MGYWKCKKCRGKWFTEDVIGGKQCVEYNKNGEIADYWDLKLKMGNTVCSKCGNNSKYIKDIAKWIEEE